MLRSPPAGPHTWRPARRAHTWARPRCCPASWALLPPWLCTGSCAGTGGRPRRRRRAGQRWTQLPHLERGQRKQSGRSGELCPSRPGPASPLTATPTVSAVGPHGGLGTLSCGAVGHGHRGLPRPSTLCSVWSLCHPFRVPLHLLRPEGNALSPGPDALSGPDGLKSFSKWRTHHVFTKSSAPSSDVVVKETELCTLARSYFTIPRVGPRDLQHV